MWSSKPPLQDEYGVVLRCVLSIEYVWVEIYGQMRENPPFLGIFGGFGTGTILVLVDWYLYQKVSTGTQCYVSD